MLGAVSSLDLRHPKANYDLKLERERLEPRPRA